MKNRKYFTAPYQGETDKAAMQTQSAHSQRYLKQIIHDLNNFLMILHIHLTISKQACQDAPKI